MLEMIEKRDEIVDAAEDRDFNRYLKMCPEDPYGNFYVRGWDDPNYDTGDWILSLIR